MHPTFPISRSRPLTRPTSFLAVLLLGLALAVSGCGGGGGASKIDAKALETAFATADPALKGPADEALRALKAANYLEAANALVAVAKASADKELSEDQRNALMNAGASIQLVNQEQGDRADLKVYQAIDDLTAALEGASGGATKAKAAPAK